MVDQNMIDAMINRIYDIIKAADSKAAITCSVATGMLAIQGRVAIKNVAWSPLDVVHNVLAAGFLLLIIGVALYSLHPRLVSTNNNPLFFGRVAEISLGEIQTELETMKVENYFRHSIAQLWSLSKIAHIKHRGMALAIGLLWFAIPAWLITVSLTV